MAASVVYLSPFVALSLQHFAWREDSVLVLVAHVQYLTEQQVLHVLDLHYRQCALFLLPLNNEVIPTNHPKTGLVFAEHKLHCTINSLNQCDDVASIKLYIYIFFYHYRPQQFILNFISGSPIEIKKIALIKEELGTQNNHYRFLFSRHCLMVTHS